jgi:group I intron endonuclease
MIKYEHIIRDKYIIYKENKNKVGIYRFLNKINGKSYVGSSTNLGTRLNIYFSKKAMYSRLKTKKSIIYDALLRHGYDDFTLEILEYCNIDVLIEREQYYINHFKSEYNILKAANSRLGIKHSLETRILMSIKKRGINHNLYGKTPSYETRKRISESSKSVIRINKPKIVSIETRLKLSLNSNGIRIKVFDKSNRIFKEFDTLTNAANYFNVTPSTIRRYLNKDKIYSGFIFKSYVNNEPKIFTAETRLKMSLRTHGVKVKIFDKSNNLVNKFPTMISVAKHFNVSSRTIGRYLDKDKPLYGFTFKSYK